MQGPGPDDIATTLVLQCKRIGAEEAKALSLHHIRELYIGYNSIGDEGAKVLSLNSTITSLYVGSNSIGEEGAKVLSLNTTITSLDLNSNKIGGEGAKALSL